MRSSLLPSSPLAVDASAIQDALDYTNREESNRRRRAKYGLSSGVVYRSEQIHSELVSSLEEKLSYCMNTARHNLILSRKYERSLARAKDIESSLKNHVIKRATHHHHHHGGGNLSQSSLLLNHDYVKDIMLIETICSLPLGYGSIITNSINSYNDEQLCQELDNVPANVKDAVDCALYIKVATASSRSKLSDHDISLMYKYGVMLYGKIKQTYVENTCTLWIVLIGILKKRLSHMHVMQNIHASGTHNSSISSFYSDVVNNSVSNSTGGKSLKVKKPLLSVTTPVNNLQPSSLQKEFNKSMLHQQSYSDEILSSLSAISMSLPIMNKHEHKHAARFAQHMAMRKLELVNARVITRTLREGLRRWTSYSKYNKSEASIKAFIKMYGVSQLFLALIHMTSNKLMRAFQKMKYAVAWLDIMESNAAAIEIQRVWRSSLTRIRVQKRICSNAAIVIQSVVRVLLSRKKTHHKRHMLRLKCAVRVVENAWKKLSWFRHIRNLFRLKKQGYKAVLLQKCYRGLLGRRRYKRFNLLRLKSKGALKFQCLYRRYKATIRVDKLALIKRRFQSAVKIQSRFRIAIATKKVRGMRRKNSCSKTIQYAWLGYRSRKACALRRVLLKELTRQRRAITIQKVARGMSGRRKASLLLEKRNQVRRVRAAGITSMIRVIHGYHAWNVLLQRFKLREHATLVLQQRLRALALGRQARVRAGHLCKDRSRVRADSAMKMSMTVLATKKAANKLKSNALVAKLNNRKKLPRYYQNLIEYNEKQNTYHYKFATRIQCMYRCMHARLIAGERKRYVSAKKIQYHWHRHQQVREAKIHVYMLAERKKIVTASAVLLQRIGRGYIVRCEYCKHNSCKLIKWFCREVTSMGIVGKALNNFRIQLKREKRMAAAAIIIQSMVRRVLTQDWFQRSYKKLVHDRDRRRKVRRIKSAIALQCFVRVTFAKRLVGRKKLIAEEAKKRQLMLDALEGRIESMHDDWMTELLAIRIETGIRGLLAKLSAAQRGESIKNDQMKAYHALLDKSATNIQAVTRGIQGRARYKKLLPSLRKRRQMRKLCVECEQRSATRKCRQCIDRFCEICFINLHQKGYRKGHAWAPFVDKYTAREDKKAAKSVAESKKAALPPSDWEEFYDKNAQSKYWFNKKSGEASWVQPV